MRAFWDKINFSGDSGPGVTVDFSKPWRLVFWKNANYVACWDLGDVWFTPEWFEAGGSDNSECYEPIMDRECRYSKVNVIESGDARAKVSWSYALCDSQYRIFHGNSRADDYYTVYPDGVAVRRLVGWPGNESIFPGNSRVWEVAELIVINAKGTRPDDHLKGKVLTIGNLKGDTVEIEWSTSFPKIFKGVSVEEHRARYEFLCEAYPEIADWNEYIAQVHLQNHPSPFLIFPKAQKLFPHCYCFACGRDHPGMIRHREFSTCYHWPSYDGDDFVGFLLADEDMIGKRVTHTSILSIGYGYFENLYTPARPSAWHFLTGVTDKPFSYLRSLATSWLKPAIIHTDGVYEGYSFSERAYVFRMKGEKSVAISMKPKAPVINPVFIIKGWNGLKLKVKLNGEELGLKQFASQIVNGNLIVWINTTVEKEATVELYRD